MKPVENFLSPQTPITTLASTAFGAGAAYAKGFAIKEAAIISVITGVTSSVITSAFGLEESTILKVVVAAVTVIGTLMALQSSANYLQGKFGLIIDPQLMSYLTAANILGQTLSFFVNRTQLEPPLKTPELTLKAIDMMDNDAIKALHANLKTQGAESFDKMGTILQIRVAERFEAIEGLEEIKPKTELTVDLIKNLSKAEVQYLFTYSLDQGEKPALTWTSWVKEGALKQTLMLRFLECGLFDKSISKTDLAKLLKEFKIPAIPEDVGTLSSRERNFFCNLYKVATDQWEALSLAAQWTIVGPTPPEDLLPTINIERVKDAPQEVVEWILTSPWIDFSREMQDALKAKCKEYKIEHTAPLHPKDDDDVTALTKPEVKTYLPFFGNVESVETLPDAAVAAMLGRFCELELDASKIPVAVFTPTRITELPIPTCAQDARNLPDKQVPWIHRAYSGSLETWYSVQDKGRQPVLNSRFRKAGLPELFIISRSLPLPDKLDVQLHHDAFIRDHEAWKKFYNSQQKAFNELFINENLLAFDVTSWTG